MNEPTFFLVTPSTTVFADETTWMSGMCLSARCLSTENLALDFVKPFSNKQKTQLKWTQRRIEWIDSKIEQHQQNVFWLANFEFLTVKFLFFSNTVGRNHLSSSDRLHFNDIQITVWSFSLKWLIDGLRCKNSSFITITIGLYTPLYASISLYNPL